ncbi:MAG: peroxiredoxin-like family protein, partial [Pseudomonadota bacterium]
MINKVILLLSFFAIPFAALASSSLVQQQQRFVEKIYENTSPDIREAGDRGIAEVRTSGILNRAANVGDYAPEFDLPNAIGERVSLYDELETGPVVLVWYRGGWCPYCNLQLQQIQASLAEIEAAGGKVIAISPELPDQSMTTKEKHDLQFDVLSDVDNEVADLYNLTYTVPDYVVDHYDLSSKLNEHNGNDNQRLPLAVTYVINRNGVIEYAFLDADYKNR